MFRTMKEFWSISRSTVKSRQKKMLCLLRMKKKRHLVARKKGEEEEEEKKKKKKRPTSRDHLYKNGDEDSNTGDLVPPQEEPGVEQLQGEKTQVGKKNESASTKKRRETTY